MLDNNDYRAQSMSKMRGQDFWVVKDQKNSKTRIYSEKKFTPKMRKQYEKAGCVVTRYLYCLGDVFKVNYTEKLVRIQSEAGKVIWVRRQRDEITGEWFYSYGKYFGQSLKRLVLQIRQ